MDIVALLVSFVFGFIEFVLGFRFLFKFLGISGDVPFVGWIYANSSYFLQPFYGIFPSINLGRFSLEFTTLAAMFLYGIIGALIRNVLDKMTDE